MWCACKTRTNVQFVVWKKLENARGPCICISIEDMEGKKDGRRKTFDHIILKKNCVHISEH